MKTTCLFILLVFSSTVYSKNENDSLSIRLNKVMIDKDIYADSKEQDIQNLKLILSMENLPQEQAYNINYKLYIEYQKYMSDSAIVYVEKNLEIAKSLKQIDLINETCIQLAWLYSTVGMYIESKELLEQIDRKSLPDKLLPSYYNSYSSFYTHYGQSNDRYTYYRESEVYRDSMLSVIDPLSRKSQITYATMILYQGKQAEAEKKLLELLDETTDKDTERALIAYLLGWMYKEKGNIELQKKYFSISVITDIENSVKDNASMQSLALAYYEMGDIDQAYRFMQSAIDDAVFCNVRYRTIEGSAFYPIINAAYQVKEKNRKSELQQYLILISALSLFLVIMLIYVYKQMKRLSLIRKQLYHANQKLSVLNDELNSVNINLQDSNLIKEEYIAHFFDLCSAYINKLEDYRKSLNKKVVNNQMDELTKMLRSTSHFDNEIENLYKNFDRIFLKLYPDFVEKFNALLLTEEQILPKQGELLNTELRIFALIRLGIVDSVKIASFLRYSLRTVYNYRTKVRNKAAVSRDEFEDKVREIGTFKRNFE